jgi:hypothetical protein
MHIQMLRFFIHFLYCYVWMCNLWFDLNEIAFYVPSKLKQTG